VRKTRELELRIRKTFQEIVRFYGSSKYRPDPDLVVFSDPRSKYFGWQTSDPPQVVINVGGATWREIVGTLVHEYVHHLQDPSDWESDYEGEAERIEERDLYKFLALT
jgi:hypothetical protein